MRLDLHIHTTASDGAWSPAAVVQGAVAGRLDVIAVSDHDTTVGVVDALAAAQGLPIQVVVAVELSTSRGGREIHILGYFLDLGCAALHRHEARARVSRLTRMETMVSRLRASGIQVGMEAVLAAAGGDFGVVGRPHLAEALVSGGHVTTLSEAFDRYIGDGQPAFEPTALLDPCEGVALVRECGGLAVWAHPPGDLVEGLLPELVRSGLRGIEVYRSQSLPQQIKRLEGVARSAGLLTTGGSDWHSPERNAPLGTFSPPAEKLVGFLRSGGLVL